LKDFSASESKNSFSRRQNELGRVRKKLNIKDLRNGMKRVDVKAKVVSKGDTREVTSRYKDETYKVADAVVADETGSIKLTLWNEQIDQVNVNDNIKVENGYVTSFKGEIQLNAGKFGKLTVE
jgi:replication factor A1